jgi:hypothetical protein
MRSHLFVSPGAKTQLLATKIALDPVDVDILLVNILPRKVSSIHLSMCHEYERDQAGGVSKRVAN